MQLGGSFGACTTYVRIILEAMRREVYGHEDQEEPDNEQETSEEQELLLVATEVDSASHVYQRTEI